MFATQFYRPCPPCYLTYTEGWGEPCLFQEDLCEMNATKWAGTWTRIADSTFSSNNRYANQIQSLDCYIKFSAINTFYITHNGNLYSTTLYIIWLLERYMIFSSLQMDHCYRTTYGMEYNKDGCPVTEAHHTCPGNYKYIWQPSNIF